MTEQESKDLESVKEDGYNLQYVKNQTEEICLAAVKQNGWTLKNVKNQTEQVCLEAAKNSSGPLGHYIKFNAILFYIRYCYELDEDSNNPFLF